MNKKTEVLFGNVHERLQIIEERLNILSPLVHKPQSTQPKNGMSVEAFGAIRRAAEIARYHDKSASMHKDWAKRSMEHLDDIDWICDLESSAQSIWIETNLAEEIRRAIRAAIKSDKA